MRRVVILLIMSSQTIGSWVQTLQGVVKTKECMVNGKHMARYGQSGATVTILGRSIVLSQASGAFSFPVTNKAFTAQGVKKQDYQLVN